MIGSIGDAAGQAAALGVAYVESRVDRLRRELQAAEREELLSKAAKANYITDAERAKKLERALQEVTKICAEALMTRF